MRRTRAAGLRRGCTHSPPRRARCLRRAQDGKTSLRWAQSSSDTAMIDLLTKYVPSKGTPAAAVGVLVAVAVAAAVAFRQFGGGGRRESSAPTPKVAPRRR